MEIVYFDSLYSTQKYLIDNLKPNLCIWTQYQTDGIGSRGKKWTGQKGNLFFSFSLYRNFLPKDLKIESVSIYFMYQLKIVLNNLGSKVKFKWPNDLFLEKKVGGIITNVKNDIIICGIGVNTNISGEYQSLDIDVDNKELLYRYFEFIKSKKNWIEIFEQYKTEFYNNNFYLSDKIDLKQAMLNSDGSISINNERIYSLR